MDDIAIPPKALEAGKDAAFSWLRSYMEDDVRVREMTDDELTEVVSAACLAMLKAWPGARIRTTFKPNEAGVWIDPVQMWSLPLTQENEG